MKTMVEVNISFEDMAKAFVGTGSDQQAAFINLVGQYFQEADWNSEFQIYNIVDDIDINGRRFIYSLANFLKARGVPCSSPKEDVLINTYPDDSDTTKIDLLECEEKKQSL
jgi:hypothetical protein